MFRSSVLLALGFLLVGSGLVSSVDAAPFPGGFRKQGFGQGANGKSPQAREELKARVDTNKDGQISPQELAAAKERMAQFQGGKPGAGNGPLGKGKPGEGIDREKILAKFDKNSDGKLDETERAAARAAFEARQKN